MLHCIAIDDEPLALELLEDNIGKVPYLCLKASFSNPLAAIAYLQQEAVDLIFLDIQMPGLNGLQFIRSIRQKPMVILVTAYERYAMSGFELDVIDYLLKPVSFERFLQACNKANDLQVLKTSAGAASREILLPYFFLNVDYSLIKIVFTDILWIEGMKDYVKVFLSNASPVLSRISMKAIEEQLPSAMFMRVQKSYIVSKEHITSIRKSSIFIGRHEIPIGDNYKEALAKFTGKANESGLP